MRPERIPLLIRGNAHLGPDYWQFSMPAILTCPGLTDACGGTTGQPDDGICYALDYLFRLPSNLGRHTANYERARSSPEFTRDLYAQIRYERIKQVRIHVAGDFFSAEYVLAWHWVARRCKTTEFLFYTRSWRIPAMVEPLVELAKLPNVYAHWSEDRDTGPCDLTPGKRCFLVANLQDELLVPPGVLVFRYRTAKPAKWINGSWVCAKEQGTHTAMTCSTCNQCMTKDPWPVAPGGRGQDGSASTEGASTPRA